MDYLLKASAIITLFYLCYKLFLQHETYFQSNRWFLLVGLIVASVLPLIVIPIYIEYTPTPISFTEIESASFQNTQALASPFNSFLLFTYIYGIGVLFFTVKFLIQLWSLKKLINNSKSIKKENFIFVETSKETTPFSFFNRIVYNAELFSDKELQHIITHEKIHASQLHSIDVIIAQLASIIFWCNPCIWLYKKELQQNLEFIADYKAQQQIDCTKSYQTVMLKASLSQNNLTISNNFYQSLIKKRIVMLHKSKSKKHSKLKLIIVLPFLALFLMSFNVEEIYVAKTTFSDQSITTETFVITSTSSDKDIEIIKSKLEAQAEGLKIKFSNLNRNSKNELTNLTIKTKLKGKTKYTHNITYESKSNKAIESIILKIENGELLFGDEKQELLMRVTERGVVADKFPVKTTPQTTTMGTIHAQNTGDNVKVVIDSKNNEDSSYNFKIATKNTGNQKSKLQVVSKNKKPLYVIDNKIANEQDTNLDTEKITHVNVLKGKNATEKYGDKGKHGVVEITTKKNSPWTVSYEVKAVSVFPEDNNSKNAEQTIQLNQSSTENYNFNTSLIIVDDKKSNAEALNNLNPKSIKSVSVLKAKNAIELYGNEAKNGAILVTTKKDNPWNVEFEVKEVEFDESEIKNYSSSLSILRKTTSDTFIEKNNKYFKDQYNIDVIFKKLKRNAAGDIVKVKILLKDNKGQKTSATFQSDNGIPVIEYGNDIKGNLIIRTR